MAELKANTTLGANTVITDSNAVLRANNFYWNTSWASVNTGSIILRDSEGIKFAQITEILSTNPDVGNNYSHIVSPTQTLEKFPFSSDVSSTQTGSAISTPPSASPGWYTNSATFASPTTGYQRAVEGTFLPSYPTLATTFKWPFSSDVTMASFPTPGVYGADDYGWAGTGSATTGYIYIGFSALKFDFASEDYTSTISHSNPFTSFPTGIYTPPSTFTSPPVTFTTYHSATSSDTTAYYFAGQSTGYPNPHPSLTQQTIVFSSPFSSDAFGTELTLPAVDPVRSVRHSATSSETHAYLVGGYAYQPTFTPDQRFHFPSMHKIPFSSVTLVNMLSNLDGGNSERYSAAGTSSTSYGYVSGGAKGPAPGPPPSSPYGPFSLFINTDEIQKWSFTSDSDSTDIAELISAGFRQGVND